MKVLTKLGHTYLFNNKRIKTVSQSVQLAPYTGQVEHPTTGGKVDMLVIFSETS